MRLFPGLARGRRRRRRLLPCVVQPAVPFRRDPARLGCAVVDHPPPLAAGVLVVDIALGVLADACAFPRGEKPRPDGLTVPPSEKLRQNAHGILVEQVRDAYAGFDGHGLAPRRVHGSFQPHASKQIHPRFERRKKLSCPPPVGDQGVADQGRTRHLRETDHYIGHPALLMRPKEANRDLARARIEAAWRMNATRKQLASHERRPLTLVSTS